MYKASADVILPTSIIGSLPRPSWYTAGLGAQNFLEAMMNLRYREQYEDAVSVYLRAQETAGLDIVTDGDAHFDEQISGMSWQSYPLTHMAGFSHGGDAQRLSDGRRRGSRAAISCTTISKRGYCRGSSARSAPAICNTRAMWKTAQRLTTKPVKFGTILPELLAASVADDYYKDPVERVWALSDALNQELHQLADAGCPVIQLEEPQIHMVPVRGKTFGKLGESELVEVFNNTVKGLRGKTEIWCHTCWGNPAQQRIFRRFRATSRPSPRSIGSRPTRSPSRPARRAPAICRRSARRSRTRRS